MGIKIKSPIVLGACNMSYDKELLNKVIDAGVGAMVYKTLFEEQVQLESFELDEDLHMYDERNAEMINLFPQLEHGGPAEHILKLKELIDAVDIPVIASLNCIYEPTWKEYAVQLEEAGAAALELNFYDTPKRLDKTSQEIEEYQLKILKTVKKAVKIPVQVKLSRFYTNALNFIYRLDKAGADSIVMFNRLFLPDINPQKQEFVLNWDFTSAEEKLYSMRFSGLLHGQVNCDLVASTGIYSMSDVASMLLAGADSVQMVSAVYRHGPEHISQILENLEAWMEHKGFNSVNDFKGNMSYSKTKDKYQYTRSQYVDILLRKKPIFQREKLV